MPGSGDFDESSIGVSTRLDFLWKRGARFRLPERRIRSLSFKCSPESWLYLMKWGAFCGICIPEKDLSLLKDSLIQHRRALGISRELLKKE